MGQDQARAQAELLRRQEELEKKAAELDRRERELQSHGGAGQSLSHTLLYLSQSKWFQCEGYCRLFHKFSHILEKNKLKLDSIFFTVGLAKRAKKHALAHTVQNEGWALTLKTRNSLAPHNVQKVDRRMKQQLV